MLWKLARILIVVIALVVGGATSTLSQDVPEEVQGVDEYVLEDYPDLGKVIDEYDLLGYPQSGSGKTIGGYEGSLAEYESSLEKYSTATFDSISLTLPPEIGGDEKDEIEALWGKLQDLCPTCATGGTIGGLTVEGANTAGVSGELFGSHSATETGAAITDGTFSETIVILKSTYDTLVRKAKAYDELFEN